MKALFVIPALAGVLLTAPAYAFRCPGDVAKIDAALQAGTNLSAAQLEEVNRLRAEGDMLHTSGNHAKSVKVLREAMDMLGI